MAESIALQADGRYPEAIAVCERMLALDHNFGPAWERLGHLALASARVDDAVVFFERAAALLDDPGEAHNNLGALLHRRGENAAALEHYRGAERARLRNPTLVSNVGACLRDQGRFEEAAQELRQGLVQWPDSASLHTNLGIVLCTQGRVAEGLSHAARSAELDPASTLAWSNYLYALNYSDETTPEFVATMARAFGARQAAYAPPMNLSPRRRDGERRLRVGFVSSDFRQHSVKYFLEPLFDHCDRSRFTFVAYADVARPDGVTQTLRGLVDEWTDGFDLGDEELAARIRRDEIDVLVDLAGHSAGGRLGVFARRAAPVQVSYLGYPATTGLATMDFRLTDARADPPAETDVLHTETLLRMAEGFLCYRPARGSPAPSSAPCLNRGHVTFGTFNALAKVSPTLLRLWARILAEVADARLLLKNFALADAGTRDAWKKTLNAYAIPVDRVELRAPSPDETAHLASYADLDVALDTFPYHGTTTTCEALWMGVPVLSQAGRSHAARVGVSLLSQVGRSDFIAGDGDDYVRLAVNLARDRERLQSLRAGLRPRLQASPLMDEVGQTRAFEGALRAAWLGRI